MAVVMTGGSAGISHFSEKCTLRLQRLTKNRVPRIVNKIISRDSTVEHVGHNIARAGQSLTLKVHLVHRLLIAQSASKKHKYHVIHQARLVLRKQSTRRKNV